jgi:hypothetical protein
MNSKQLVSPQKKKKEQEKLDFQSREYLKKKKKSRKSWIFNPGDI